MTIVSTFIAQPPVELRNFAFSDDAYFTDFKATWTDAFFDGNAFADTEPSKRADVKKPFES